MSRRVGRRPDLPTMLMSTEGASEEWAAVVSELAGVVHQTALSVPPTQQGFGYLMLIENVIASHHPKMGAKFTQALAGVTVPAGAIEAARAYVKHTAAYLDNCHDA